MQKSWTPEECLKGMCSLSYSRLEDWLRVHLLSCLSFLDEATKEATFLSHSKYSWISASEFFLCLFSVLSNPLILNLVLLEGSCCSYMHAHFKGWGSEWVRYGSLCEQNNMASASGKTLFLKLLP
ncbi:hypothetical protein ILYODFUR_014766 [Ilyodon furcidens]|uniref:Uncharacterized protein n=1 Tax=Ilyodon furcidens TaxID=33524 RepID=A0ABV0SMX5_9TELE